MSQQPTSPTKLYGVTNKHYPCFGEEVISFFKDNFCMASTPFDCVTKCVIDSVCRKTKQPVAVVIELLPVGYDIKKMMEEAFVHPQLTPLIDITADEKNGILFTVCKDPKMWPFEKSDGGIYIHKFIEANKDRGSTFLRKNAKFVLVKLLNLLKALDGRDLGLFKLNALSIILTTDNGGDITDMTVRRCHVTDSYLMADIKNHVRSVAKMFEDFYEDEFHNLKSDLSEAEREFFGACKPEFQTTLDQLLEMPYMKYDDIDMLIYDLLKFEVAKYSFASNDDDNISNDADKPDWQVFRNKVSKKYISKNGLKTVEDYVTNKIDYVNDAEEGSSKFGFVIPTSKCHGFYHVNGVYIRKITKTMMVCNDKCKWNDGLFIGHAYDGRVACVKHKNHKYRKFGELPTMVAEKLVAARYALMTLHNENRIFEVSFAELDTKFTLHQNGFVTLQHLLYEVTLSPTTIAAGNLESVITDENCRQAFEVAMKLPITEQCSETSIYDEEAAEAAKKLEIVASNVSGTVMFFKKNYGFIRMDGTETDAYVNCLNVAQDDKLKPGAKVQFDLVWNVKGLEAVNVTGSDDTDVNDVVDGLANVEI